MRIVVYVICPYFYERDDTCRRGPEKSSLSRELLLLSHHPLIHYYLRASTLPHSLTQTSCSCNSKLGRRRSRLKGSNVCYECIDFCYYSAAAAVFLTSIVIGTPNFAHSCELTTKWNSDQVLFLKTFTSLKTLRFHSPFEVYFFMVSKGKKIETQTFAIHSGSNPVVAQGLKSYSPT